MYMHQSLSYVYIDYNVTDLYLFLTEQMTERDKFMSPLEAKDFGIVDHVLAQEPAQDKTSDISTSDTESKNTK